MGSKTETGARQLPETHWSHLIAAGNSADPRHGEHLNRLLQRYWKPVYHYLRAWRGLSPAEAEDLTQGFFEMVLDRNDLAKLSPERGSFRGYLKTAIKRFVISHDRHGAVRTRLQRSANFPFTEAEALFRGGDAIGPEESFDRSWAREVLAATVARLKAELAADGRQIYFEIFSKYTLEAEGDTSYESLAQSYGIKVHDVRHYLAFVRARGAEILHELLGEYLFPDENVEAELSFIFQS